MLGGETSGHILCLDKTTTGDGLVSALQVLAVMKQTGRSLAELASGMRKFPQVLLNVKVARALRSGERARPCRQRWRASSSAWTARAAWCCGRRAPSR